MPSWPPRRGLSLLGVESPVAALLGSLRGYAEWYWKWRGDAVPITGRGAFGWSPGGSLRP
jgi:hypothetical protein